jgi:hypothetical protein
MTSTENCEACRFAIHPDHEVVQGETVIQSGLNAKNEPVLGAGRVVLFHAECWGAGLPGYKEIYRGLLSEVQARS